MRHLKCLCFLERLRLRIILILNFFFCIPSILSQAISHRAYRLYDQTIIDIGVSRTTKRPRTTGLEPPRYWVFCKHTVTRSEVILLLRYWAIRGERVSCSLSSRYRAHDRGTVFVDKRRESRFGSYVPVRWNHTSCIIVHDTFLRSRTLVDTTTTTSSTCVVGRSARAQIILVTTYDSSGDLRFERNKKRLRSVRA